MVGPGKIRSLSRSLTGRPVTGDPVASPERSPHHRRWQRHWSCGGGQRQSL